MAFLNTRDSRYDATRGFSESDNRAHAFAGTRSRDITRAVGVLEHTLKAGERLDLLALHYYNDPKRWWRILDANPHIHDAGRVIHGDLEGTVIVIPSATERTASP